jgi:cytochrome c2
MPVGDETYYNLRRMHVAFAVAVLALLGATVWMWKAESQRAWKGYQREYRSLRGLPARSPAIEQIWLPELTIDYHFRGVARFDRCTTCHLGIDQAASGADIHVGRGSGGTLGSNESLPPQPFSAHPRLHLFVGANSPHPMSEFGCTICHDGQGSATDFHWASHTPNDRQQRHRWRAELGWSDNPHWDYPMLARRLDACRCLVCHLEPVELEANLVPWNGVGGGSRRRFEGSGFTVQEDSTSPKASAVAPEPRTLDPKPSPAAIRRLESPLTDAPAATLMAGYHLVRQYGCFGCHEIPAFANVTHKVGPSLQKIADKFDADYLARRIRKPADALPTTRMPRLFGLDEHLSGRVSAETRRSEETEIHAVVEYLLASAEKVEPPASSATAPPSAQRGRRLFEMQGCLACHRHGDFPTGQAIQSRDLSNVGKNYLPESGRRWLAGWIADPARYSPQTLMPNPLLQPTRLENGKTADPAADLAAYLLDRSGPGTSVPSKRKIQPPADRDFARRTIARRGCAGCHDIPGLDSVPRIGPTLAGWARKPESMLAFERINDFVKKPPATSQEESDDDFFTEALSAHRREGFLWQKLRAPRSFDYAIADGKPIDQQLKMGRFELTDPQREAIATFVLAQVDGGKGDSPHLPERPSGCFAQMGTVPFSASKYVYHPGPRRKAVIEGRKVIDKYACSECHTLELERWTIKGKWVRGAVAARKNSSDPFFVGMPRLDRQGALLEDEDDDGKPQRYFTLWSPAVVGGRVWAVGGADVPVTGNVLVRPAWGGALARLLYPVVLADARQSGQSAAEMEAWGWLPPALVHEGTKVQPEWLFRFLLDPTPIRPAAVLRMPRFNLSRAEAGKLAGYFAAVADAEYPHTPKPVAASTSLDVARLDRAMRLVRDRTTFCSKCHTVDGSGWGGSRWDGSSTATPSSAEQNRTILAPRLDEVCRRLRPEYLRRWLADPKSVLPYTAMPSLFSSAGKPLGQDIFPGSSRQRLDAVVELLLRYEEYTKHRTPAPAP